MRSRRSAIVNQGSVRLARCVTLCPSRARYAKSVRFATDKRGRGVDTLIAMSQRCSTGYESMFHTPLVVQWVHSYRLIFTPNLNVSIRFQCLVSTVVDAATTTSQRESGCLGATVTGWCMYDWTAVNKDPICPSIRPASSSTAVLLVPSKLCTRHFGSCASLYAENSPGPRVNASIVSKAPGRERANTMCMYVHPIQVRCPCMARLGKTTIIALFLCASVCAVSCALLAERSEPWASGCGLSGCKLHGCKVTDAEKCRRKSGSEAGKRTVYMDVRLNSKCR